MSNILDTIFFKPTRVECNPNIPSDKYHWNCYFSTRIGDHAGFSVTYSMGKDRPPTIDEVLSCLFEEAYQAQEGFEYWADSCGYDRDSRKAFETYQVIQKQTDSLVHLLGENFCEVRSAVS